MAFKSIIGATFACLAVISFSADATLLGRLADTDGNFQAYYDTDADLTWLADANYAQTSGYNTDGRMTWADANSWAAGLIIEGVDGWRLYDPGDCIGDNCTTSEMYNLFDSTLGYDGPDNFPYEFPPFINVVEYYYWSSKLYTDNPYHAAAVYYDVFHKQQADYTIDSLLHAWAVHTGDVSAVPEPPILLLIGSGLIGLIGVARRKTHS